MEDVCLNKACPKDLFPLLRIDQIVDSTSGCETLYFLDAYSGYHQISMKESDQLAMSFITPFGSFCYVIMSFGLKMWGLCINVVCLSVLGACRCGTHRIPRKEERRSSLTRILPM